MNILITGASGFIGSNILRRLLKDNHTVSALHLKGDPVHSINDVLSEFTLFEYDGSTESVLDVFIKTKPEVVFHLASCFLSTHGPDDVKNLIDSNVLFGTQLLEGMKYSGCKSIINTGTSWQHYRNEDYNPVCLYAATKQAFEDILLFYIDSCSFSTITLKLFDTFGRNDPRPKLMNLLKEAVSSGRQLEMSPGEQMLDLVYIDDVIEAYINSLERITGTPDLRNEVFAVSSGEPIKLKELVELYKKVTGAEINIDFGKRPYREREVMDLWDKGEWLPGWKPEVSLEEGIIRINE
jgi:nucleoside-diphosphate-sugar epimerase